MSSLPDGYTLRVATEADFSAVRAFYDELIDELASRPYHPMWSKEGHPSDDYLRSAISGGELWLADSATGIAGVMVINGDANDGYKQVPWNIPAEQGEFVIVHAFGVSARHQGRGLGSAMMHAVMCCARAEGKKCIRLDLIDHNRPTEKIYLKLGFTKCAEIQLYYEEVGWQIFHMFEYAL